MPSRRVSFALAAVALAGLVLVLAAAEAVTRVALERARSPLRRASDSLGWETAPNVHLQYSHPAFGPVSFTTGPHGFRRWDGNRASEFRLLIIGDSYTEAAQVSTGKTWFDHVARLVPSAAVFAYGTGGYGTLQELLILDRHVDSIAPDVIVWQLSANDLINNDFFLETQNPAGARMLRPFYENGTSVRRVPAASSAVKYSRLARFISARVAMLRGHGFAPASLDRERKNYPDALQRAIGTTKLLMNRATERAGGIPIVAFVAEGDAYADSVLQTAAIESGWMFIPGIRDSVDTERARGVRVDGMPRDGHWNANGHAVAGRVIARGLGSVGVLRKHHRGNNSGRQNPGDNQ